ncbi:MAG: HAMP domain-containing sensor histidine kinase, partial [Acidobacteriota bacterium]|nr:HAMP domain-containing sensor histidine kinase [Acidobacteriota bacterium]
LAADTLGDRPAKVVTRLKNLGPNLSLTAVIVTLAVGVILPVILSTSVGIVSIALGEKANNLVIGMLVICFAAASIGGAVTATVLLGRKARTARLQADFLANVSHELRTPLSAIRMYAQTLQNEKLREDPEKIKECVDTIIRETEWLETTVDRVLTWRSAAKDRMVLELRIAPMAGTVQTALDRFSLLTAPGEVKLRTEVSTTAPVAHDSNAIVTVLLNLLINAYKYTGEDKQITVHAFDEGSDVILEVEDNGIGIPPSDRRRIFEPFFRSDDRLRGQSSGAGLGLAITQTLVKAHQGTIDVTSQEGSGTCMTVRFPVASPNATEADS